MMLCDTHAHLYDDRLKISAEAIIKNMKDDNLEFIIVPTSHYDAMKQSLSLGATHENVYSALGVHPICVQEYSDEIQNFMLEKAKDPKVVAIGEIGLDYFRSTVEKRLQIDVFEKQLNVARISKLPIIFHVRDALPDFFDVLKTHKNKGYSGVVHCFSGNKDDAKKALDFGYNISVTCNVTYRKSTLDEVLAFVPMDRLLIETDCPYLPPEHLRGKVNEPKNVRFVAERIASVKKISFDTVCEQSLKNARALFAKIK